eukprot:6000367-Lingulodinium_polyedra.AAC.1
MCVWGSLGGCAGSPSIAAMLAAGHTRHPCLARAGRFRGGRAFRPSRRRPSGPERPGRRGLFSSPES